MKLHGMSVVAAFGAFSLLGGCATVQKTTAPTALSVKGPADAIIYVSGLT
ncbi:MAG: hypothetical protein IID38_10225 [Planctomycetes bacterium]|nr:hypothetical protein [Planctomycetota bacterium]